MAYLLHIKYSINLILWGFILKKKISFLFFSYILQPDDSLSSLPSPTFLHKTAGLPGTSTRHGVTSYARASTYSYIKAGLGNLVGEKGSKGKQASETALTPTVRNSTSTLSYTTTTCIHRT